MPVTFLPLEVALLMNDNVNSKHTVSAHEKRMLILDTPTEIKKKNIQNNVWVKFFFKINILRLNQNDPLLLVS